MSSPKPKIGQSLFELVDDSVNDGGVDTFLELPQRLDMLNG